MICIDSSALLAIILGEAQGPDCRETLRGRTDLIMSAATLAEVLIVGRGRGVARQISDLVDAIAVRVIELDKPAALRVADAYATWGRGFHAARLNYGDCFAYELAMRMDCPLLFVGDDFSRTDVKRALQS